MVLTEAQRKRRDASQMEAIRIRYYVPQGQQQPTSPHPTSSSRGAASSSTSRPPFSVSNGSTSTSSPRPTSSSSNGAPASYSPRPTTVSSRGAPASSSPRPFSATSRGASSSSTYRPPFSLSNGAPASSSPRPTSVSSRGASSAHHHPTSLSSVASSSPRPTSLSRGAPSPYVNTIPALSTPKHARTEAEQRRYDASKAEALARRAAVQAPLSKIRPMDMETSDQDDNFKENEPPVASSTIPSAPSSTKKRLPSKLLEEESVGATPLKRLKLSEAATPSNALAPSTSTPPTSSGKKKADVRATKITNDYDLSDLQEYRDTNSAKPPYCIGALLLCYFVEKKKRNGTSEEMYEYFLEFKYYGALDEKAKTKLKKNMRIAVCREASIQMVEGDFGTYEYLKSIVPATPQQLPPTVIDPREFLESDYNVHWEGTICFLEGYRWMRQKTNEKWYAKCTWCRGLQKLMDSHSWKIGDEEIAKHEVWSLKMKSEHSTVVNGCPWRPRDVPHFCLQNAELRRKVQIESFRKRIRAAKDKMALLFQKMEARYEESSEHLEETILPAELQSFLHQLAETHASSINVRPAFLYMLRIEGSNIIKYYGISLDYDGRFVYHPNGGYKALFESEDIIEMVIAPIGRKCALEVRDLEASLIQLSQSGELEDGNKTVNVDKGKFSSKAHLLKTIIEKKSGPEKSLIIDALNQLINLTMAEGEVLCLSESSTPTSKAIHSTNDNLKRTEAKLERIMPPTKKPATQQSQTSLASQSQLSQTFPPARCEALYNLLEELHQLYPYSENQEEFHLYMLIRPENKNVLRFGISSHLNRRENEHGWNDTVGEEFQLIEVPLQPMNEMAASDLEAILIRLAKKKLLKDGHDNKNAELDNGMFYSKNEVYRTHLDSPSPRRDDLVLAANQLIKFSIKNNSIV